MLLDTGPRATPARVLRGSKRVSARIGVSVSVRRGQAEPCRRNLPCRRLVELQRVCYDKPLSASVMSVVRCRDVSYDCDAFDFSVVFSSGAITVVPARRSQCSHARASVTWPKEEDGSAISFATCVTLLQTCRKRIGWSVSQPYHELGRLCHSQNTTPATATECRPKDPKHILWRWRAETRVSSSGQSSALHLASTSHR